MPEPIHVELHPGNLPQGQCYPADPNDLNKLIVEGIDAILPGSFSGFNYGPNQPPVDQQHLPWIRTDAAGTIEGIYTYSGGDWVRPYRIPPNSPERSMWRGTIEDLQFYDGGDDVTPASEKHGAFWVVDHDYDSHFPIGPGTRTTTPPTTISVGSKAGSDTITVGATALPQHKHVLPLYFADLDDGPNQRTAWTTADGTVDNALVKAVMVGTDGNHTGRYQLYTSPVSVAPGAPEGTPPAQTPVDILNPYVGTYFIKRTSRSLIIAPTATPAAPSHTYSGYGPPPADLGVSGDTYIDKTAYPGGGMYFKTDSGWKP